MSSLYVSLFYTSPLWFVIDIIAGVQRLLPRARLPHRSHCLQVRRDPGEGGQAYRQVHRGRAQVYQVWGRSHREAGPLQAHVCRALLRVPSPRQVQRQGYEADIHCNDGVEEAFDFDIDIDNFS